jgi:hypothetical protein
LGLQKHRRLDIPLQQPPICVGYAGQKKYSCRDLLLCVCVCRDLPLCVCGNYMVHNIWCVGSVMGLFAVCRLTCYKVMPLTVCFHDCASAVGRVVAMLPFICSAASCNNAKQPLVNDSCGLHLARVTQHGIYGNSRDVAHIW